MLNNDLEIILFTYNRAKQLRRTLEQLFAENSPIRHTDITILDNHSTDATFDVIQEYARKFSNVKHVRHNRNIGGVANSLRAFEMASRKYVWVLCDDDRYDWTAWSEVESAMARNEDLICIARYALSEENKDKPEHQIFQLTFIPAGIYKTTNITEAALRIAYDNINSLLPQTCFVAGILNAGKRIHTISSPIVLRSQLEPVDETYTRGYKQEDLPLKTRAMCWIVGYANVCSLLKDEMIKHRTLLIAIDFKEIHDGFDKFCEYITYCYTGKEYWTLVLSLFLQMDKASQRILLESFMKNQIHFMTDEKVMYEYFLKFGAEYSTLFSLPNGEASFSKKVYSMKLEDGTLRTISVFDTAPKVENVA